MARVVALAELLHGLRLPDRDEARGRGSPRARASSYGLTYCAHNGATVARSSCKFLHVAVNVFSITPKNPLYSISSASDGRSFNKMYRSSSREYAGK